MISAINLHLPQATARAGFDRRVFPVPRSALNIKSSNGTHILILILLKGLFSLKRAKAPKNHWQNSMIVFVLF